jgi:hypothetical protein
MSGRHGECLVAEKPVKAIEHMGALLTSTYGSVGPHCSQYVGLKEESRAAGFPACGRFVCKFGRLESLPHTRSSRSEPKIRSITVEGKRSSVYCLDQGGRMRYGFNESSV